MFNFGLKSDLSQTAHHPWWPTNWLDQLHYPGYKNYYRLYNEGNFLNTSRQLSEHLVWNTRMSLTWSKDHCLNARLHCLPCGPIGLTALLLYAIGRFHATIIDCSQVLMNSVILYSGPAEWQLLWQGQCRELHPADPRQAHYQEGGHSPAAQFWCKVCGSGHEKVRRGWTYQGRPKWTFHRHLQIPPNRSSYATSELNWLLMPRPTTNTVPTTQMLSTHGYYQGVGDQWRERHEAVAPRSIT